MSTYIPLNEYINYILFSFIFATGKNYKCDGERAAVLAFVAETGFFLLEL
jgi:hypothetical protein